MAPIFWISVATAGAFVWLAWRGSQDVVKAGLAGVLVFGLVMVGPPLVLAFVAHFALGDFRAYGGWTSQGILAGNGAAWVWALWQRFG